ncbi:MAG TPA: hypothetical protein VJ767_06180 [Nitrososphaeraceae archaeon]|nr:hypothetical protein [Nitrososphaeraceae archaeon]
MTKFKVSFNAIGLNGIFRDRKQYLDYENEVLYALTENNQKQITVTIEADTEEEAESKSKSLIHKSLAKICFAFHEEGSIIQEGCSSKI